MLKQFTVSGFKSIRSADLSFGRVNLFIGANGAGKSNILEALGVFSASLKDISDVELQKRGVRLSVPNLFKSSFKNTKLRPKFDLKGAFDGDVDYAVSIKAGDSIEGLRFFSEKVRHKGVTFMGRSPNGITVQGISAPKKDVDPARGLWDRFYETIELPESLEYELRQMATYAIFSPQTAFLRGNEVETTLVQPIGLQGSGIAQAAAAVMQYAFSPGPNQKIRSKLANKLLPLYNVPGWASQFRVQAFEPVTTTRLVKTGESSLYFVDKFMSEKRNLLSAYDSSEGTLYLLFMATLLLHPKAPRILALDNVDNALNPSVTKELLEKIILATCSEESRSQSMAPDQVFITSHNPTSLDAFDIFDKDQRIFVVSRGKTGETQISRLEPPSGTTRADWIKRAEGRRLSELWIEGFIEGALGL